MKVLKFGGTSMADAAQYRKIADIVHAEFQNFHWEELLI